MVIQLLPISDWEGPAGCERQDSSPNSDPNQNRLINFRELYLGRDRVGDDGGHFSSVEQVSNNGL